MKSWKCQITNPKYQMVRQAHHPEPSRRANHNDKNPKSQTFWTLNIDEFGIYLLFGYFNLVL
jgi:hypothetical protein